MLWKTGPSQCCLNLSNVHLECYASNPEKLKAQAAIGYMIPYNHDNWEKWFQLFVLQTQCEYTVRNGCKFNNQSWEKGVIRVNKDKFMYTSSWVHTYSYLRGGEGKFNPLSLKKKSRISVASSYKLTKYEFVVFINTKLLQISFTNNFKVIAVLGSNGCSSSNT